MSDLVSLRPLSWLKSHYRPGRPYCEGELDRIGAIITQEGFSVPIVVDRTGNVLAGHGAVEVARRLKLPEVPCTFIEQMDDTGRSACLADHYRLALRAGWDEELLGHELEGLFELDAFAVSRAGPSSAESVGKIAEDLLPDDGGDGSDAVSQEGDLWLLGRHRLVCGDPADASVHHALMGDDHAHMIFIDPLAGQETKSRSGLVSFLIAILTQLSLRSLPGSTHFICSEWRNLSLVLKAGEAVYGDLKSLIVWVKSTGRGGVPGRSCHELILTFQREDLSDAARDPAHDLNRYLPDVWQHTPANGLCSDDQGESLIGPVTRPSALIAGAIDRYCEPDGIVLDAFCGSGTVLIAAEQKGRRARAVESSRHSCDQAIRRWELYTGQEAIHNVDGKTFRAMTERRSK